MNVITRQVAWFCVAVLADAWQSQVHASGSLGNCKALLASVADVRVPVDWRCAVGSNMVGGEKTPLFSFYPERGFSSIIFQQVKPGSSPNSLQGFVEQYSDNLKDPQTIVVKPHVIQVGGNDAVEAVSRGDFSLDVSGVGKATGKTIFHTLVLQDKSNFYTCDLQVMEANYKDQLRRLYIDFCASIKFKSN